MKVFDSCVLSYFRMGPNASSDTHAARKLCNTYSNKFKVIKDFGQAVGLQTKFKDTLKNIFIYFHEIFIVEKRGLIHAD